MRKAVLRNSKHLLKVYRDTNMIIDISQEVLSCKVYPGDPSPEVSKLCDMNQGEVYNLTSISMCNHNGTHVDAPAHFLKDGKTIDQISLDSFVGECYVACIQGDISKEMASEILEKAQGIDKILLAGELTVTAEAAAVFAKAGIKLLGNESQSVGPEDAPMEVHKILLEAGVVLLEGIVLTDVEEGKYFLSAAPLNIAGCEGAPCRAYLIK